MDKIKNAKTVQVICYGTLMTGECNHGFCQNAISIEPCIVTGTLYDTGWGFPAFVLGGTTQLKAELIEIPIEDWPAMDRLEGYPRLYDRQLCHARLAADGREVVAWIYIMNNLPATAKIIVCGDWKQYRKEHER